MSEVPDRPAPPQPLLARARSWVQWVGAGRVVAVAVVVLAVVAGAYWLVQPPATTVESTLPFASPTANDTAIATSTSAGAAVTVVPPPEVLVVHVAGAVLSPGVHRLPAGARVVDAVAAAGGPAADANPDALNLAAPLVDGQRVYVPAVGESVPPVLDVPAASPGGGEQPAGPVNLNSAAAEQLETLPGIGPATAAAIVAYRDEHGPFQSIDELADVSGIGPAKLDSLRGLVTV